MEICAGLPLYSPAASDQARAARAQLRVDGLVAQPLTLGVEDLAQLEHAALDEPFVCEEGWTVPGLRWRGYRLADIVALARPLPAARYVRAGSGEWVVPVALSELERGLVCDELNGERLTLEHGAPLRLVVSGGPCFANVKWLDHLAVVAEPGEDTARRIALGRLADR
jgi:DMSO/TMAO reductase YedYZ molybdopterin-dependent catalytic subunit